MNFIIFDIIFFNKIGRFSAEMKISDMYTYIYIYICSDDVLMHFVLETEI